MKMIDSASEKNIVKLISKNSDLPIIPIVNNNGDSTGFDWWAGNITTVTIGEYAVGNSGVAYMKDGTNVVKTICDFDDAWAKYQDNPSNKDEIYNSTIPWKKAVLVFVHR